MSLKLVLQDNGLLHVCLIVLYVREELKIQIWCQDALRQLWRLSYPDRPLPSLKSELWKEMGWQGSDPSTDFRYMRRCIFDSHFCLAVVLILKL